MPQHRATALQIVRDGNPGHHPKERLEGGVRLKPGPPDEPKWSEVFPSVKGDAEQQAMVKRWRGWASDEWQLIVPRLDAVGLLSGVDREILLEHCAAWATVRECYRDFALYGLWFEGKRGYQKNPASTILAQARDVLKRTTSELGLSPLARDRIGSGGGEADDAEDPFD